MNTFNRDLKMYCLPEFISFYNKCNDRQQTIVEEAMLYNVDICNDMFNIICNQLYNRGTNLRDTFTSYGAHTTWFNEYLPLLYKLDFCAELGLLKLLVNANCDSFYIYTFVDAIKSIQIFKYVLPRSSIVNHDNLDEKNIINNYILTMQHNYSHVSQLINNDVHILKSLVKNCSKYDILRFYIDDYPIVIQYSVFKCLNAMINEDEKALKEFCDLYISHVNTGLYNNYDYTYIDYVLNEHNIALDKPTFINIPVL